MSITTDEITRRTIQVLLKIKPDSQAFVPEHYDTPLTSPEMGMRRYDMVYLFLELMEEFGIRFEKEDVCDYKFSTIRNIVEIILGKLA